MAEIFISYAREAEPEAARIAQALIAEGYDVWWDSHLPVHRAYSKVIEENLRAAKAVLVIWSKAGLESEWVLAEADFGRQAKMLVQAVIDEAVPPLPFNQIQFADLRGWNGEGKAAAWRKVIGSLAELTGRGRPAAAPETPAGAPTAPSPFPGADGEPLALPAKPSIAVLPFQNMSGDPEQEYFADAVTEDIITALSRWRWFFVIARNSSFSYKGADIDVTRVGRELGVRYVLEGSVRKVGARVRVSAQLIDAATGVHIWADRFDRDLVELLALQDEITEEVVAAIEPAMRQSEGARIARKPLSNLSALDCFQRGMWHLNKTSWHLNEASREDYDEALSLFRKAVGLDGSLSLGHVGLARALYGGAIYNWSPKPTEDLHEAKAAAQTAIRLDARDALGYFASSGALLYLGEHEAALDAARRTIALNPNFGFGHFRLGQVLLYGGRPAEAAAPIERSLRFSPYDPQVGAMHLALAWAHFHAGAYEAAIEQAKMADYLGHAQAGVVLAVSLVRLGKVDEAALALRRVSQEPSRRPGGARAPTFARPADRENFREALWQARQALEARETNPASQGPAA
ncbi:MAG TPA: TIR domain-containing protein [Caulobacteraceae bacterium]|nr:TIR domain-containing protein [Caulobacteraceae bacterium]